MKLFSGNASKDLALKIANQLNVDLSPMEIFVFADGEKRVKLNEKVLGQDCVLIQSTGIPTDINYMELFFILDALKRSGAKSITLFAPYLGYSRQDHVFREGEEVSLQVIIKIIETLGMDKIISFDFHSIKIPEFFKTNVIHLSALDLFAEHIKKMEDYVLVSPDMGGIRRIKLLSEMLGGAPFVFAGASSKILQESKIEKFFVTDTIKVPKDKAFPKLEIISVANSICQALKS